MRIIKGKKVTWIDIFRPSTEDIATIRKVHKFHPILLDEVSRPSVRTRIEAYDNYLFLIYHFPEYDIENKTSRRSEIDLLITKNTIITVHYDNIEYLNKLFDELSRDTKERNRILGNDTLLATYSIFEKLLSFSLRQLHHIEEQVTTVTNQIFDGNEEHLLKEISYVKRNILDYRLITHPQEKFFTLLHDIGMKFWGDHSRVYLADLISDNLPVHRNLENYFVTVESLETTNAQLLDAQTNKIIKRFTVGAFLFSIPLYFAFFSEFEPFRMLIASSAIHFWISFTLIHGGAITLWFVFKRRKII